MKVPATASYWTHSKSGDLYKVRGVGRLEATGQWLVSYSPIKNLDWLFFRPLSEWYELVLIVGEGVQRFVPGPLRGALTAEVEIEPFGDEARFAQGRTTP